MRVDVLRGNVDLHAVHRKDFQPRGSLGAVVDVGRGAERFAAERPVVTGVSAIDVVRDPRRAAADRAGIGAVVPCLEQLVYEALLDQLVRLQRAAIECAQLRGRRHMETLNQGFGADRRQRVGQHPPGIGCVPSGGVRREPLLGHEVPARRAARPLLREDLDDARGRLRPVQRRGRCAFENLDMIDRLGVDIVEP